MPTPLAAISTLLGTLSIISWLFAQLPQIYKNYQLQSTAGLSMYFLVEWCLGDTTNLLGALFTKQAGWQVVVASYYVFVDVCLVYQFFWYTHIKPQWITGTSLHSGASSDRDDSDSIADLSPINTNFHDDGPEIHQAEDVRVFDSSPKPIGTDQFREVNYSPSVAISLQTQPPMSFREKARLAWKNITPSPSPRNVLTTATFLATSSFTQPAAAAPIPFLPFPTHLHLPHAIYLMRIDTPLEIAGTILAWTSTLLYLGSRLPQLYKNYQRQSTAGLSPLLFLAAFCGNWFYSASLITNPNAWSSSEAYGSHGWVGKGGNERAEFVVRAAPFFLGAAGVLMMDAAMGVQFVRYGEWRRTEEKLVKVRTWSEQGYAGYGRWRKVDGWMRGWIPEVKGKEKVVDLRESQRLLGESGRREMEGIRRSGGSSGLFADYGAT